MSSPTTITGTIANRRNAMQRLLDAGAIIVAELRESRTYVREVFLRYLNVTQIDEIVRKARFGLSSEIEHDFHERFEIREPNERLPQRQWKDIEELSKFPVRREIFGVNGQCTSSAKIRSRPVAGAVEATVASSDSGLSELRDPPRDVGSYPSYHANRTKFRIVWTLHAHAGLELESEIRYDLRRNFFSG